ncbi:MAG: hypothetical protein M1816_006041 [Peltula sp. TS41687]|nr:MAG: hypothetical protein M1816_006041 [Peltula sp. TS41687]
MQLRKTIKRPQKYEPGGFPDASPSATTHLVASRYRVSSALRPEIIEYNPNLPVAAFPTLSAIPIPPQTHEETAQGSSSQNRQNIFQSQMDHEPDGPDGGHGHNMAKLDEQSKLTEADWLMREMEPNVGGDAAEVDNEEYWTPVTWDDLSHVHRLSIIDALMEIWKTPDVASLPTLLSSIGLTSDQIRRDCIHLIQRRVDDCVEAEKIKDLQSFVTSKLLEGGKTDSPGISQAAFGDMVQKHLYKDLTEQHVSTKKEWDTARLFVVLNLGLDPGILGEWVDIGQSIGPQENRVDLYDSPPQTASGLHMESSQGQAGEEIVPSSPSAPGIVWPATHSRPSIGFFPLQGNGLSPLAARFQTDVQAPPHQRLMLSQPQAPDAASGSRMEPPPKIKLVTFPPDASAQKPGERQDFEVTTTSTSGLPAGESEAETELRRKMGLDPKASEVLLLPRSGASIRASSSAPNVNESTSGIEVPSSVKPAPLKRKRGRPPVGPLAPSANKSTSGIEKPSSTEPAPPKKKKGRPPRSSALSINESTSAIEIPSSTKPAPLKKKKGRPARSSALSINESTSGIQIPSSTEPAPPKKKGQPPRSSALSVKELGSEIKIPSSTEPAPLQVSKNNTTPPSSETGPSALSVAAGGIVLPMTSQQIAASALALLGIGLHEAPRGLNNVTKPNRGTRQLLSSDKLLPVATYLKDVEVITAVEMKAVQGPTEPVTEALNAVQTPGAPVVSSDERGGGSAAKNTKVAQESQVGVGEQKADTEQAVFGESPLKEGKSGEVVAKNAAVGGAVLGESLLKKDKSGEVVVAKKKPVKKQPGRKAKENKKIV